MRYGSVCSGIEAASVAWKPLGWRPAWFAEIDAFPSAVLAHRFPEIPNLGDFTTITEDRGPIDLLVGGTPCQSFSVAGLRRGMADDRGNLALEFLRLAGRTRPRWVVWENVPGVLSSNGGRDFGAFLGGLAELGYGWSYRVLDAQYVRVDGFGRAVPQRRRRVFVVGHLGDWRRAAAVLFDRESLSGNHPPRREAGEGVARDVANCLRGRCSLAHREDADTLVVQCLTSHPSGFRIDAETETFIPVAFAHQAGGKQSTLGFDAKSGTCPAVVANQTPAIASQERGRTGGRSLEWQEEVSYTLRAIDGGGCGDWFCIATRYAVRRLTPTECERLQGFPDGWTLVPYRGKPAKDGPRYKAIGNSMPVNVMRWLGTRIQMVEDLT